MPETKLHRIQAKLFLEEGTRIELGAMVPLFHRWIQDQALGELLIDVANYAHVKDGPGVVLIAHEADYALDLSRGRPGLLYTRKRDVPASVADAITQALEQLLRAARLLEEDASLSFRFNTNEVELLFPDRLRLPNSDASLELVRGDVERVLSGVFGEETLTLQRVESDERLPLAASIQSPSSSSVSELLERLVTAVK